MANCCFQCRACPLVWSFLVFFGIFSVLKMISASFFASLVFSSNQILCIWFHLLPIFFSYSFFHLFFSEFGIVENTSSNFSIFSLISGELFGPLEPLPVAGLPSTASDLEAPDPSEPRQERPSPLPGASLFAGELCWEMFSHGEALFSPLSSEGAWISSYSFG